MAEVRRLGLSRLSGLPDSGASQKKDGENQNVNIILVHGLRGHPKGTWESSAPTPRHTSLSTEEKESKSFRKLFSKSPNRSSPKSSASDNAKSSASPKAESIFWPQDYLAVDMPDATIYTYGYNADLVGGFFDGPVKNSISQYGNNLMVEVVSEITDQDPIIFVTHSLGGIIVKDALRRSKTSLNEDHKRLHAQTAYVVFMGTPHRGSEMSGWGLVLSNIASATLLDVDQKVLRGLQVDSEILDNIHDEFLKMLDTKDFRIHSFVEGKGLSGTKGFSGKVVADFSSKVGQPSLEVVETIDANHMHINRYSSREDEGYRKVLRALRAYQQKLSNSPGPRSQLSDAALLFEQELKDASPTDQLHLISEKHPGTLQWIDEHPTYRSFKAKQASGILWLRGDVGCGKSVAMKSLIQQHGSAFPEDLHAHFFCDGKDDRTRNAKDILKSFLHQIAKSPEILQSIGIHGRTDEELVRSETQVSVWFQHFFSRHCDHKRIWLFIDGLDEMYEEEIQKLLLEIRNLWRTLSKIRSTVDRDRCPVIRLVVSARPYLKLQLPLQDTMTIDFYPDQVDEDIAAYVTAAVSCFGQEEGFTTEHMDKISQELIHKSEGMFLWAYLAWERFKDTNDLWSARLVRQKMEELEYLPRGLAPLLVELLGPIKVSNDSRTLFTWIVCARRPLTLHEIEIATGLQDDVIDEKDLELPFNLKGSILKLCGPLIRIHGSDDTVHLIHTSIKQFFTEASAFLNEEQLSKIRHFQVDTNVADRQILLACLKYLSFPSIFWGPADTTAILLLAGDDARYRSQCQQHALLDYASSFWANHLSDRLRAPTDLVSPIRASRTSYLLQLENFDINTPHFSEKRLLHLAVEFSWLDILKQLLMRKDIDIYARDSEGHTAFHRACYWGLKIQATNLLDHGYREKVAEIEHGLPHAFEFLLKQPNMEDVALRIVKGFTSFPVELQKTTSYAEPLLVALLKLQWDNVFDFVITFPNVDTNVVDMDGNSALHIAAMNANVSALKALIKSSCNIHVKNHAGRTALHYAAEGDSAEVLELLLSTDLDCNEVDIDGATPMHFAMSNDLTRSMRALLVHGADPDVKNKAGQTPFIQACFFGQVMLVQDFLVLPRCDKEVQDSKGNNAIHWAATGRQTTVLNILLDAKQPNALAVGQFGRSIAHLCTPWADSTLLQRIFEIEGTHASFQDQFGQNCLHKAALRGDLDIFMVVLSKFTQEQADVNEQDSSGRSPLHLAAGHTDASIFGVLLDVGADASIRDKTGKLAEHIAMEFRTESVLRELGWSEARLQSFQPYCRYFDHSQRIVCAGCFERSVRVDVYASFLAVDGWVKDWLNGTLRYSNYGMPKQDFYRLNRGCHLWIIQYVLRLRKMETLAALLEAVGPLSEGEFNYLQRDVKLEPNYEMRRALEEILRKSYAPGLRNANFEWQLNLLKDRQDDLPFVFEKFDHGNIKSRWIGTK